MKILSETNIQLLMEKMSFVCKKSNNEDADLSKFVAYINFLVDRKDEIIKIINVELEDVAYSHYYWFWALKEVYFKKHGKDEGLEQQALKILETMNFELQGNIDWEIIEQIENGCIEVQ